MGVKTEIEYKCSEYKRRGATDEEHGRSKRRLGAKRVLSYRKRFEVAKGSGTGAQQSTAFTWA